ncbi:MAG: hypothetical protein WEB89_12270 [Balneolales bacterium]
MRFLFFLPLFLFPFISNAQNQEYNDGIRYSQQFRLGEGIVRIAEPGELSDTLNVWGDINNPGRYLVPRGMSLTSVISYSRGPSRYITGETTTDWSKVRLEVSVSHTNEDTGNDEITNFQYRYNEPIPEGMRDFKLHNNDVIAIQVRRRPSFADYVRVIAPVVSTVATSFLIMERLRGD